MDILLRYAVPVQADFQLPLPPGKHFAAVTFDDAMVSIYEQALPEMEKRGIPATVFAVSGKLGQSAAWGNYSEEPLTPEPTVNSEQLRTLAERALVGSHTVTHPMLTRLSEAEAKAELRESRTSLEHLLDRKVTLFSFPYGDFNGKLIKWSGEAGYQRVFTTLPSVFESEDGAEAAVVGRVPAEPTDWPLEFRLKLLGAYSWLPTAFKIKRKLRRLIYSSKRQKSSCDIRREHSDSGVARGD
jgi:peptidoglycan/xylan/chitin deacetylase (PgdA/CDA1 family)